MMQELSSGRWRDGRSFLSILDEDVAPVDGHEAGEFVYRMKSEYNEDVNKRNPPAVDFTPSELRSLIHQTRNTLGEDPFDDGNFVPLDDWYHQEGERVIAEVGSENGERKQFKVMEHEDSDSRYLKVQRRWFDEDGEEQWHQDSPTLGPDEFEGVFGRVAVL